MNYYFILFFSISMLMACKPSASVTHQQIQQDQAIEPDAYITFGYGGGFTGKVVYYLLDNKGSLSEISNSDTLFIKLIDEEIVNRHFTKCQTIVDQIKPFDKPGNMFNTIRFNSKKQAVEYIWGQPQFEVPGDILNLFDVLKELP